MLSHWQLWLCQSKMAHMEHLFDLVVVLCLMKLPLNGIYQNSV